MDLLFRNFLKKLYKATIKHSDFLKAIADSHLSSLNEIEALEELNKKLKPRF